MRSDITVGATFPDYELPDHTGTRRKLSEIQDGDPMILVLSRGYYCPKDRMQHRVLVDLEPDLVIHSVYNGYWYWGRPGAEDLRRDLREVTQKIRPDWDLGKPGLREAWERDEKDGFWPYGKSLKEVFAASA